MDNEAPGTFQMWVMMLIGIVVYPIVLFLEWYGRLIVDLCSIVGLNPYNWAIIQWLQGVLGGSYSSFIG